MIFPVSRTGRCWREADNGTAALLGCLNSQPSGHGAQQMQLWGCPFYRWLQDEPLLRKAPQEMGSRSCQKLLLGAGSWGDKLRVRGSAQRPAEVCPCTVVH